MIIITCSCGRSWAKRDHAGADLTQALMADPCPQCGVSAAKANGTGTRTAETCPDPRIGEVLAGLTAWKEAPARFLRWNVMVSRENPNEATVTVLIGAARSVGEWCAKSVLVCEVDRTAARITRVSTAEQYPRKTALRPLKDGIALRGVIADLVLTIGLDLQPVTDWQRLAANAGSRN